MSEYLLVRSQLNLLPGRLSDPKPVYEYFRSARETLIFRLYKMVLHLPSTYAMMEDTYQNIVEGSQELSMAKLLMLFTVFAGAAITWTPQLLKKLHSTQEEAKAAFMSYTRLAMSILDNVYRPLTPSTTALAAIATLAYVLLNADSFSTNVYWLRSRCILMARMMQIDRIDTAKSVEGRRFRGPNAIETEVQRRIWWYLVASDW